MKFFVGRFSLLLLLLMYPWTRIASALRPSPQSSSSWNRRSALSFLVRGCGITTATTTCLLLLSTSSWQSSPKGIVARAQVSFKSGSTCSLPSSSASSSAIMSTSGSRDCESDRRGAGQEHHDDGARPQENESEFDSTGYLDAESAAALDVELMSPPISYTLEQLMELAGLAVAQAVYQVLPVPPTLSPPYRVLIVCGPGNNGGDGLVAARHLALWGGYQCTIVYPKQPTKGQHMMHFEYLVQQCQSVGIPILTALPTTDKTSDDDRLPFDLIVDAIFGFSYSGGAPREPFGSILHELLRQQTLHNIPIVSVDVPSGWNVDEGDVTGMGFVPNVLVSLTAPKQCAKTYPGQHFVGGRFLPHSLGDKYGIRMPHYPGTDQVVQVSSLSSDALPTTSTNTVESWEQEYARYLAEKEAKEFAAYAKENASTKGSSDESWEVQYAAYLAEKEANAKDNTPRPASKKS